jgi:hypothetical protein
MFPFPSPLDYLRAFTLAFLAGSAAGVGVVTLAFALLRSFKRPSDSGGRPEGAGPKRRGRGIERGLFVHPDVGTPQAYRRSSQLCGSGSVCRSDFAENHPQLAADGRRAESRSTLTGNGRRCTPLRPDPRRRRDSCFKRHSVPHMCAKFSRRRVAATRH